MDHTLGNVMDRYLFEGNGSDQFIGRVASGLNFESIDFSMLPSHFLPGNELSLEDLRRIVSGYDIYPPSFRACIVYTLFYRIRHISFGLVVIELIEVPRILFE